MTAPTIREIRRQFVELPVYAPVRAYIRGAISSALGDGNNRITEKALTDRECVTHSLIAEWLETSGYKIAAQMMRTQMSDRLVDTPSQFVRDGSTIEGVLSEIHVEVPRLERRHRDVINGQPFRRRKEPVKIEPLSDDEFRKTMGEKLELERNRLARFVKPPSKTAVDVVVDEDSSSSSSSSSDSSDSSSDDATSPKPVWQPSELTLVTDHVSDVENSRLQLPPIAEKAAISSKDQKDEIDALFGDDFEEEDEKKEEPVVLSEGESIDELEDFDTGLLSSGGSDYSF